MCSPAQLSSGSEPPSACAAVWTTGLAAKCPGNPANPTPACSQEPACARRVLSPPQGSCLHILEQCTTALPATCRLLVSLEMQSSTGLVGDRQRRPNRTRPAPGVRGLATSPQKQCIHRRLRHTNARASLSPKALTSTSEARWTSTAAHLKAGCASSSSRSAYASVSST